MFALGNSSYPNFCAFGKLVDKSLEELGAQRVYQLGLGDELNGQEKSYNQWSYSLFMVFISNFNKSSNCKDFNIFFLRPQQIIFV